MKILTDVVDNSKDETNHLLVEMATVGITADDYALII